ncbi:FAD-binding protein [Paenibacillaceae bacterium]|nr:FAD-binding protein [Paenibacillaceae bacterium]
MTIVTDVLVIGGGQAALATAYYLQRAGLDYIVVDGGERIGDAWRNRYDSLVLFTPRSYSQLPGMDFPGDPEQFPDKNDTADYLEKYAAALNATIHLQTKVLSVHKEQAGFVIATTKQSYRARQIVIATGPFQTPWMPAFAAKLSPKIRQLHSSEYRNPEQLQQGDTLVVGAGNSGAQIAVELADVTRVSLSAGEKPVFLPLKLLGKSIFYWFDKLGLLRATRNSFIGKKIQQRKDPIFGKELKQLLEASQVAMLPKTTGADKESLMFSDGQPREFANIIWSTGFHPDYSWLRIPRITNAAGALIHERGKTAEHGLYVVGMPWQHRRTSALLGGVGEDARFVVAAIKQERAPS